MTAFIGRSKCPILVGALAMAVATGLPAFAQTTARQPAPSGQYGGDYQQPTAEDGLIKIATAVNQQRTAAFARKDVPGVAATFTPDAVYVELMPRLEIMRTRADIQRHYQELLDAETSNINYTVTSAEMAGNDAMSVGGDFVLTVRGDKQVNGHFFQLLRRDGGVWRIATHVFSRPEPVTRVETEYFQGG